MSDRGVWFFSVATAIFLIMIMVFCFDYSDCKEKGGKLVEGVFWYECVNTVKIGVEK